MNKLELLINDPSSPILSAIRSSEKYEVNRLPGSLQEYTAKNGGDFKKNPVNVTEMIRDARRLGKINEELDKIADLTTYVDQDMSDKVEMVRRREQAKQFTQFIKDK